MPVSFLVIWYLDNLISCLFFTLGFLLVSVNSFFILKILAGETILADLMLMLSARVLPF